MQHKAHTFLVEAIYTQVFERTDSEGEKYRDSQISQVVFTFSEDKREVALGNANKHLDEIRRYGIKLQGGSVIKSYIMPSAILQVGVIDYNKYVYESKKMKEDTREEGEETGKA